MYVGHCREETKLRNRTDCKQIASFYKTTCKFVVFHLHLMETLSPKILCVIASHSLSVPFISHNFPHWYKTFKQVTCLIIEFQQYYRGLASFTSCMPMLTSSSRITQYVLCSTFHLMSPVSCVTPQILNPILKVWAEGSEKISNIRSV